MKKRNWLLKVLNFYPPFWGAGIKVYDISKDFSHFRVRMKLTFWNRNYVGTHFGGSIYAMCDPFFMLILIKKLGDDYLVWDKVAKVEFIRPGLGTLFAEFFIIEEEINAIKDELEKRKKMDKIFTVSVTNETGDIIAKVEKIIYIRKKGFKNKSRK
jgi:hypothetical protein